MPFVIELKKSWAVGMIVFQVDVVDLGLGGCVPTIFADVHLRPSLFVIILVSHPMNFQAM